MMCRPWHGWDAPRLRAGSAGMSNPAMRVSDSERAEVAETLSKHYADGRLDQVELDERLQKTMAARTRADLGSLLTDLPAADRPALSPPELHRRRGRAALFFITVLLFMVAFSVPVWPRHFPWLLLAIGFFLAWRLSRRWGLRRHG